MDVKRNWPWKKKVDKCLPSIDLTEASSLHLSGQIDDQDLSKIVPYSGSGSLWEDASTQVQQLEEKLRHIEERLTAALKDISLKDDLVKQHTKIAEEAVSGWEKAEGEAVLLRQRLDTVLQQKLATEDRVLHLDNALKECTKQLRLDRDEQEQKIHEAVLKKTRYWDKMRCELEEKLEDITQKLMEAEAKGKSMSNSLNEQACTISEISQARSQAESEIEVLKFEFQSLETHNASLKYEVHVLNKELEIRNEERELSRRTADATNKQHLENVKKTAKLEAECQKLRALVRKKLPGPAALAQMKIEAEVIGNEKHENRKISISRGVALSKAMPQQHPSHDNVSTDMEALLERLYAMEGEEKSLRETLAKRNRELQSARIMCARMASKLSSAEQQLEALSHIPGFLGTAGMGALEMHVDMSTSLTVSKEPSLASLSEDGNDDEKSNAESWASALIAELVHFKKTVAPKIPEKNPSGIDLMDDFVEMERLASMSRSKIENRGSSDNNIPSAQGQEDKIALQQMLANREADMEAANRLYEEARNKLTDAKEQLSALQSQNASKEFALVSLQEKLDLIFEAHEAGANIRKVVEEVRASVGASSHNPVARLRAQVNRLNKSFSSAEFSNWPPVADTSLEEESPASLSDAEATMADNFRDELASAVCNVVRLVENLVEIIATCQFGAFPNVESEDRSMFIEHTLDPVKYTSSFCNNLELNDCLLKLSKVSNGFLQGKADLVSFMSELSSLLNQLYSQIRRNSFSGVTEQDEISGVNGPVSDTSKSEGSVEADKVVPENQKPPIEISKVKEELSIIQAEKMALESQIATELTKSTAREEERARLKGQKTELEHALTRERGNLEHAKVEASQAEQFVANLRRQLSAAEIQISEAKQLSANLRIQLSATEEFKDSVSEQLAIVSASKTDLESQLKIKEAELKEVKQEVRSLEKEILEDSHRSTELKIQCQQLQEQLQHEGRACYYTGAVANEAEEVRLNKERELAGAAEQLAECQRTILALGTQLKSLASQGDLQADSAATVRYILSGKKIVQEQGQNTDGRCTPDRLRRDDQLRVSQEAEISDILDKELANISKQGHAQRKAFMMDLFGNSTPVLTPAHEDYIEAVALMPSSPESDLPNFPPKSPVRRMQRKKKTISRSFTGIDPSKPVQEANSRAPSEKHGSSFVRFFSRNKASH